MKKRLISLMLAGAMVGAVGTMAGCGEENAKSEQKRDLSVAGQQYGNDVYNHNAFHGTPYTYEDIYIVLEQNGKQVLHHGDVKELLNDNYWESVTSSGNWLYDFDCSAPFASDWGHAFFDEKPSQDFYIEECEDCLNNQN